MDKQDSQFFFSHSFGFGLLSVFVLIVPQTMQASINPTGSNQAEMIELEYDVLIVYAQNQRLVNMSISASNAHKQTNTKTIEYRVIVHQLEPIENCGNRICIIIALQAALIASNSRLQQFSLSSINFLSSYLAYNGSTMTYLYLVNMNTTDGDVMVNFEAKTIHLTNHTQNGNITDIDKQQIEKTAYDSHGAVIYTSDDGSLLFNQKKKLRSFE
jgi:hypothetical protein